MTAVDTTTIINNKRLDTSKTHEHVREKKNIQVQPSAVVEEDKSPSVSV
jgi:hypothetical protein